MKLYYCYPQRHQSDVPRVIKTGNRSRDSSPHLSLSKTHTLTTTLDVEWVCVHKMLGRDGEKVPTMSLYFSSTPSLSRVAPD